MLGYSVSISTLNPEEKAAADRDTIRAHLLVYYEDTSFSPSPATSLQAIAQTWNGDGYPYRCTLKAGDVLPILRRAAERHAEQIQGHPNAWIFEGYRFGLEPIAAMPPDTTLYAELWDLS